MLVLGINTATLACSVALATPGQLLVEYTQQISKTHSEKLLPLVAAALHDAGLAPEALDGVAVAAGPGSFTGVRIGVTTARALGQALNIKLAAVSTLEALCQQAPYFPGLVSPILDARRQQVYNAVFRAAGLETVKLVGERAVSLADLLAELQLYSESVLFLGDAVQVHREEIVKELGSRACFLPPTASHSGAASVAWLGLSALAAGRGVSYRDLLPLYVRGSAAETGYRAGREGGVSAGADYCANETGAY
ncbi:MAG: tRNA threonylcarbamoyladenosine biosynthesis protein TsaB [Syntrophomonadaceae bacterium]|nr:tRNA threonylcarbamoyladenosine biosynthesis protein TsaB [Bacillota bacterium]